MCRRVSQSVFDRPLRDLPTEKKCIEPIDLRVTYVGAS